MRDAPTPAYISTKSEPLENRNGTLGFARDRPRQQRLAGAGRSDEQHALRNASADRREARRLAQEIDDLLHFLLGLVDAGDVGEGDRATIP